jgi:hypothetical protein
MTRGNARLSGRAATKLSTFCKESGAGCIMNGAIDATAAEER